MADGNNFLISQHGYFNQVLELSTSEECQTAGAAAYIVHMRRSTLLPNRKEPGGNTPLYSNSIMYNTQLYKKI